jgi:hypothetical protein
MHWHRFGNTFFNKIFFNYHKGGQKKGVNKNKMVDGQTIIS